MTQQYYPSYDQRYGFAPKNGFGTAALVLGIVGAIFAVIPIIGIIAWPMVIVGLVLGVLGILRANKGVANNRGVAIAGTALSAVGLALCIIWTVAFAASASDVPTASAPSVKTPAVTTADAGSNEEEPSGIGSGTFIVGQDIQPGTYKSAGAEEGMFEFCSWSIQKGPNTNSGILDFGTANANEQMVVKIGKNAGAFTSSNCEPWVRQ